MKIILSAIVFLFTAFSSCSQTHIDVNEVARKEYLNADKELNRVYQKIIANSKTDTLFIKNLKKAQRAWIAFRDAQTDMKYPNYDGNRETSFPMCWCTYRTELTRNRIEQLKVWLKGIEEGDICIGSVPFKK